MLPSFSFTGRILWLLTVTNRVVKNSQKPDAFTAIQNKFCHRDQGLNSITLFHSAEYQKFPSYSAVHGGLSGFDFTEMTTIAET